MPGCVEYSVLINNQLVVTYSNGCKFTDGINVVEDLKKQHQGTCQPLRYFREIKNLRKKCCLSQLHFWYLPPFLEISFHSLLYPTHLRHQSCLLSCWRHLQPDDRRLVTNLWRQSSHNWHGLCFWSGCYAQIPLHGPLPPRMCLYLLLEGSYSLDSWEGNDENRDETDWVIKDIPKQTKKIGLSCRNYRNYWNRLWSSYHCALKSLK